MNSCTFNIEKSHSFEFGKFSSKKKFSKTEKTALITAGVFGHTISFIGNTLLFPLHIFRPAKPINHFLDYGFYASQGLIKSANQEFNTEVPELRKQIRFVVTLQYSLSREWAHNWKPVHKIATINGCKILLGRIPIEGDKIIEDFQISKIATFTEPFEIENTSSMNTVKTNALRKIKVKRTIYKTSDYKLPSKETIIQFCNDFFNKNENTLSHCKAGRGRSALNVLFLLAFAGLSSKNEIEMKNEQGENLPFPKIDIATTKLSDFVNYISAIFQNMKIIRPQVDLSKRHFIFLAGVLIEYKKHYETGTSSSG